MIQRDYKAFQDVRLLLNFAELILRTPRHDLVPMVDKMNDCVFQCQCLWSSMDKSYQICSKRLLASRVLVELVFNNLGLGIFFQFNDDPHTIPITLITQIADILDPLISHQFSNLFHQDGLIDLIWNLCNHKGNPSAT